MLQETLSDPILNLDFNLWLLIFRTLSKGEGRVTFNYSSARYYTYCHWPGLPG